MHFMEAEEEAALFVAHGFLEPDVEDTSGKAHASSFGTKFATNLDMKELRACAFLNTSSGKDKLIEW
jgi:hypothetical protein